MNQEFPNRRAVIDIGTNSVKLLVADVVDGQLEPVSEKSKQTRLGAGFYKTRKLQRPAIAQTAEAVAEFASAATQQGASPIRLIATSAARDAHNAGDLVDAVRQSSGLEMEILSGDREAEWVFRGVTTDPRWAKSPLLILDVGGGSTEFIVGDNAVPQFQSSYSMGTVRLLEDLHHSDPPGLQALAECRAKLKHFLEAEVARFVDPALRASRSPVRLIGTGGTSSILARIDLGLERFDREKIDSARVTLPRIREHLEHQWELTLTQRQHIIGMPAKRADVILTGMAIYEAIMEQFGFDELGVSTRGLRYWALLGERL